MLLDHFIPIWWLSEVTPGHSQGAWRLGPFTKWHIGHKSMESCRFEYGYGPWMIHQCNMYCTGFKLFLSMDENQYFWVFAELQKINKSVLGLIFVMYFTLCHVVKSIPSKSWENKIYEKMSQQNKISSSV